MKKQKLNFYKRYRYLFLIVLCFSTMATAQTKDTIQAAWYTWKPYQYVNNQGVMDGLEYAIITRVFQNAGIKVNFDPSENKNWKQNQKEVLIGEKKITAGAFWNQERDEKYLISKPYRYEWNTLYVLKNETELSRISDINKLLNHVRDKGLKLGVISGYHYTSPVVNNFINKYKENKDIIVESITEEENFDQLVKHKVDIIIADRISGAQIIWKNKEKWKAEVLEHPLQLPKKPLHLLMHKGKDSLELLQNKILMNRFNSSLEVLEKRGELKALVADYLFPVLMNITVQTKWFSMIDYVGAIFFAIAGFLMARESRFDIFGVIIMVTLLTSGGGIMRDLLVSRTPSFLKDATYVYIILTISALGYILSMFHSFLIQKYKRYYQFIKHYSNHTLFLRILIESIALGAYTIIGVGVAVEMSLKPLWLWGPLLSVLTSCGGGILAGCLKRKNVVSSLMGGLDPEVSILGGIGFSLFLLWQINRLNPQEVFLGVLIAIFLMATVLYLLFLLNKKSPVLKIDSDLINEKEL